MWPTLASKNEILTSYNRSTSLFPLFFFDSHTLPSFSHSPSFFSASLLMAGKGHGYVVNEPEIRISYSCCFCRREKWSLVCRWRREPGPFIFEKKIISRLDSCSFLPFSMFTEFCSFFSELTLLLLFTPCEAHLLIMCPDRKTECVTHKCYAGATKRVTQKHISWRTRTDFHLQTSSSWEKNRSNR